MCNVLSEINDDGDDLISLPIYGLITAAYVARKSDAKTNF